MRRRTSRRAMRRACHRTWRRNWPSGPGRQARLPRLATRHHRRRRRLCAAHAEIGAQLGSSAAFGSGCGQALPGVPRKAPLCILRALLKGVGSCFCMTAEETRSLACACAAVLVGWGLLGSSMGSAEGRGVGAYVGRTSRTPARAKMRKSAREVGCSSSSPPPPPLLLLPVGVAAGQSQPHPLPGMPLRRRRPLKRALPGGSPSTPRTLQVLVLLLLALRGLRLLCQRFRWIKISKNMSLIIVTSFFFFCCCCCVLRGRGRRRSAVLEEAPHHEAIHHATRIACPRERLISCCFCGRPLSRCLVGWAAGAGGHEIRKRCSARASQASSFRCGHAAIWPSTFWPTFKHR